MEGRHRLTERLNRLVRTATQLITPSAQRTGIADIAETQRPAYSNQLLDWTLRNTFKRTRRTIFPAIATGRGSQTQRRSLKDFEALCEGIRRSTLLFIVSALGYIGAVDSDAAGGGPPNF